MEWVGVKVRVGSEEREESGMGGGKGGGTGCDGGRREERFRL